MSESEKTKRKRIEEEEENNKWFDDMYGDLAGMAIGSFLPVASGYRYDFKVAPDKKPEHEPKSVRDGKEFGERWKWEILLMDFAVVKKSYAEILKDENPRKHERIMNLQLNEVYILSLGKKATAQLAQFLRENGLVKVRMVRSGSGFQTVYKFTEAAEE